jgi:argonaute-like protein implicated in RNA metabolism and viral defense
MGHPYEGELDAYLARHDIPFEVRTGSEAICADRLKARYTLAEGGQGGHISLLSGRAIVSKHSLSASKTYMVESDFVFQPRVFTELQHAQAIAVPYDGLNPLPPQYCYLKPYYLDVQTSYFEHVERGAL